MYRNIKSTYKNEKRVRNIFGVDNIESIKSHFYFKSHKNEAAVISKLRHTGKVGLCPEPEVCCGNEHHRNVTRKGRRRSKSALDKMIAVTNHYGISDVEDSFDDILDEYPCFI